MTAGSTYLGKGATITIGGTATFLVNDDGIKLPESKFDVVTYSLLADTYKRKIAGQIDAGGGEVHVNFDVADSSQTTLYQYLTGSSPTANSAIAFVYTEPSTHTLSWSGVLESFDFGEAKPNDIRKAVIKFQVSGYISVA